MATCSVHDLLIITSLGSMPMNSFKMATEAQAQVQHAVEQMLNDVERQRLRPLLVTSPHYFVLFLVWFSALFDFSHLQKCPEITLVIL